MRKRTKISKNPNHPVKGSSTLVQPIRDERAIKKIMKLLENPTIQDIREKVTE